jgi:glucan endo-1,3-alpha-glucosidase
LYLSTLSDECSYLDDFTKTDIRLASSKGIDAFALNIGSEPWQPDRVADAYRAAKAVSNSNNLLGHLSQPFKLFLSFDMSAIPCASASDGNLIRHYVDTYHAHPNQLIYGGQPFYSTFAGEGCTFGAGGLNEGWMNVMKKNPVTGTHFVPSFFIDPAKFHNITAMDGAFSVSPSLWINDFS